MANGYPSLDELIRARRVAGPGEAIQSGLEGFVAGRKRRMDEDEAKAKAALEQVKQRLEQQKVDLETITPDEAQAGAIQAESSPAKFSALKKPTPAPKPIIREGPNGELVQVHMDEKGNVTGTTMLTGPRQKQVGDESTKQAGDFNTLAKQIDLVKQTFKPEFVGAVQGRTGKLAQAIDVPEIGLGASKDRADFLANVNSIRNQLIYLRSGKQINESEYARLLAELPNENSSDTDFRAKLDNFQNVFNEIAQNRQKAFAEAGYRNIPSYTPPQNTAPTGTPAPTGGLSPDKQRRLAELRAKRDAGTLGK